MQDEPRWCRKGTFFVKPRDSFNSWRKSLAAVGNGSSLGSNVFEAASAPYLLKQIYSVGKCPLQEEALSTNSGVSVKSCICAAGLSHEHLFAVDVGYVLIQCMDGSSPCHGLHAYSLLLRYRVSVHRELDPNLLSPRSVCFVTESKGENT